MNSSLFISLSSTLSPPWYQNRNEIWKQVMQWQTVFGVHSGSAACCRCLLLFYQLSTSSIDRCQSHDTIVHSATVIISSIFFFLVCVALWFCVRFNKYSFDIDFDVATTNCEGVNKCRMVFISCKTRRKTQTHWRCRRTNEWTCLHFQFVFGVNDFRSISPFGVLHFQRIIFRHRCTDGKWQRNNRRCMKCEHRHDVRCEINPKQKWETASKKCGKLLSTLFVVDYNDFLIFQIGTAIHPFTTSSRNIGFLLLFSLCIFLSFTFRFRVFFFPFFERFFYSLVRWIAIIEAESWDALIATSNTYGQISSGFELKWISSSFSFPSAYSQVLR